MKEYRRICADIDLDALTHNLDEIHRCIRKETKIIAVVKADGYGHGAVPLAEVMEKREDVWGYAVATPEEAEELYTNGIKKPILILGYTFPEYDAQIVQENLRPAVLYNELKGACPLKEEITEGGFDLMIMRELTGGLYFGERKTEEVDGVMTAFDSLTYNEDEIRRIAIRAFDIAMKRRKKVTSVDKANVLDSSRLWRKVVEEVAKDYPEVTLEHMLVDNCAMQLVHDPGQFDVILTENMFGDILSDEASMVTGSIGMLASASLNETRFGLYEPSGGSAPDIAGKGIANPIATILSAAMMLRYSFDLDKEAKAIEDAVQQVLTEGYRTVDIMADGCKQVGTVEMGRLICERIR